MRDPIDALYATAIRLNPRDRAKLARRLMLSLEEGPGAEPETETEAAWAEAVEARLVAYDAGELQALSVEETLERIDQALAEQRGAAPDP